MANTLNKKEASIALGRIVNNLLKVYGFTNYNWENFVVIDTKNGINWGYTLAKITQHWGKLSEAEMETIGQINSFAIDAENTTFHFCLVDFTVGVLKAKK